MEAKTLSLDGEISILIGPNGGGKTNLLDAVVVFLRRHLFASMWPAHAPTEDNQNRYEFRENDALNRLKLEKHAAAESDFFQVLSIELEVTEQDIENMAAMKSDAPDLQRLSARKYFSIGFERLLEWNLSAVASGDIYEYRLVKGQLEQPEADGARFFLEYLKHFEIDSTLRDEYDLAPLATPMVYLPVNRSAGGFSSSVQLANFQLYEQKRQSDAVYSRSSSSLIPLAIGRLAQKYRLLLEKDSGSAKVEFYSDENLKRLGNLLKELGYEWALECTDPLKNEYDVKLSKQGTSFLVGAASSGERELLTYMFAIFALNVRDALIVVDEPELHLHPKWQKTLLNLFVKLTEETGNQFLLATHSPTFVAPDSIQYVTRVYIEDQRSRLIRLNSTSLPNDRHLFNIVNSQNNERIFFADRVILVEGLSDRIFFERVLDLHGRSDPGRPTIEVIAVGGKGLFPAYQSILDACKIEHSVIADRDYLEQVGTEDVKKLFKINSSEIKKDVIENVKSKDGDALVSTIESAIESGDWGDARSVWDYIKSKRKLIPVDLDADEEKILSSEIQNLKAQRIFILRRGTLENYLPPGFKRKDIDKLIQLVASADFWERLDGDPKVELKGIAEVLVG